MTRLSHWTIEKSKISGVSVYDETAIPLRIRQRGVTVFFLRNHRNTLLAKARIKDPKRALSAREHQEISNFLAKILRKYDYAFDKLVEIAKRNDPIYV